uniref:Uncharacterized protein n=1 Tax=Rhizophora mucronata TaxID=61149 RepID=A0A2P2KCS1_RHIMU
MLLSVVKIDFPLFALGSSPSSRIGKLGEELTC